MCFFLISYQPVAIVISNKLAFGRYGAMDNLFVNSLRGRLDTLRRISAETWSEFVVAGLKYSLNKNKNEWKKRGPNLFRIASFEGMPDANSAVICFGNYLTIGWVSKFDRWNPLFRCADLSIEIYRYPGAIEYGSLHWNRRCFPNPAITILAPGKVWIVEVR